MFIHTLRFNGSIPETSHWNAGEDDGNAEAQPPGNHYAAQDAHIDRKALRGEDPVVEEQQG